MKKFVFIIFVSLSTLVFGQNVSLTKQYYYVSDDKSNLDTVCCLVYKIKNESTFSQVIMFTEDNVNRMPLRRLIKSKMYRRYGDFSLSQFVSDNVDNQSNYVMIPEFFVKFLSQGESFDITLLLRNEDESALDSIFREHVLICNLENVDCKEMFYGFKKCVDEQHLEYPYRTMTLLWTHFKSFLSPPNGDKEKQRR